MQIIFLINLQYSIAMFKKFRTFLWQMTRKSELMVQNKFGGHLNPFNVPIACHEVSTNFVNVSDE